MPWESLSPLKRDILMIFMRLYCIIADRMNKICVDIKKSFHPSIVKFMTFFFVVKECKNNFPKSYSKNIIFSPSKKSKKKNLNNFLISIKPSTSILIKLQKHYLSFALTFTFFPLFLFQRLLRNNADFYFVSNGIGSFVLRSKFRNFLHDNPKLFAFI